MSSAIYAMLAEDIDELNMQKEEETEADEDLDQWKVYKTSLDPKTQKQEIVDADVEIKKHRTTIDTLRRNRRQFVRDAKDRYNQHMAALVAAATVAPPPTTNPPAPTPTNLVPEMKLKDPASFSGNPKDYARFIFEVNYVIRVREGINTDVKKISYLGSLLVGTAFTWYRMWCETNTTGGNITNTYNMFLGEFQVAFHDPMEVQSYIRAVRDARQGYKEYSEYAIEFMNLCLRAGLTFDSQLETFRDFLNFNTLNHWHPNTMPITFATLNESIRTSVAIHQSIVKSQQMSKTASTYPNQRYGNASSKPSNTESRLGIYVTSPLTQTYKQRMNDGQCTRCGVKGHLAKDCSNYPILVTGTANFEKSKRLFPDQYEKNPEKSGAKNQEGRKGGGEPKKIVFNNIQENKEAGEDVKNTDEFDAYLAVLRSLPSSVRMLNPLT